MTSSWVSITAGYLFQGAGEEVEGVCDPIGVSDGRLCQVVVVELDGVGD